MTPTIDSIVARHRAVQTLGVSEQEIVDEAVAKLRTCTTVGEAQALQVQLITIKVDYNLRYNAPLCNLIARIHALCAAVPFSYPGETNA